jgi:hypothetical protein
MKLSLIQQLQESGSIDLLDSLRLRGQKRVDARHLVDDLRKEAQMFVDERAKIIKEHSPDGSIGPKDAGYSEVVAAIVDLLDSDIDTKDPFLFTEAEAMEYDMTPAQERCLIAAGIIDNLVKPCEDKKGDTK